MKISSHSFLLAVLLFFVAAATVQVSAYGSVKCSAPGSRCYGKTITCPYECPSTYSEDPKAKVCYLDCDLPTCKAQCKHRKPNCNSPGSACYDPRFVGGDGIVFYFHGKSSEHFSLVSDSNLQINARFIGHRPEGRTRDFTWIQALGVLFKNHAFSLEATKVATWDNEIDHLKFTYNGNDLVVPEGHLSLWYSPEKDIKVERISSKNGVVISLENTSHDCFAHLEVQFRFFALSPKVEGVLGRTYQPDFENPAKPGVAMPVVGGEEKYKTSSLLSPDCQTCAFSPDSVSNQEASSVLEYGTLDCTRGSSEGYGIVCRK